MHSCSRYPSSFIFLPKEDNEGKTEDLISYVSWNTGIFFSKVFFIFQGYSSQGK